MGYTLALMPMSEANRQMLIIAIATREGTADELAERYGHSTKFLRSFVNKHKDEIQHAREQWERESTRDTEPTPVDLDRLWISNKVERLQRLQKIADRLYNDCMNGFDPVSLREFRSYCMAAANELGQLLHRGSGDSTDDTLNVNIDGVDFERLR